MVVRNEIESNSVTNARTKKEHSSALPTFDLPEALASGIAYRKTRCTFVLTEATCSVKAHRVFLIYQKLYTSYEILNEL